MTIIADATPALGLFYEVKSVLHKRGYDSRIMSLYQVRPINGPWYMEVMMVPYTRAGKYATIELLLDDVSGDGVVAHPRLTLYPTNSSEIRDNLRHNIESRIARQPYRLGSRDLAHLVADALDSAGIAEK